MPRRRIGEPPRRRPTADTKLDLKQFATEKWIEIKKKKDHGEEMDLVSRQNWFDRESSMNILKRLHLPKEVEEITRLLENDSIRLRRIRRIIQSSKPIRTQELREVLEKLLEDFSILEMVAHQTPADERVPNDIAKFRSIKRGYEHFLEEVSTVSEKNVQIEIENINVMIGIYARFIEYVIGKRNFLVYTRLRTRARESFEKLANN